MGDAYTGYEDEKQKKKGEYVPFWMLTTYQGFHLLHVSQKIKSRLPLIDASEHTILAMHETLTSKEHELAHKLGSPDEEKRRLRSVLQRENSHWKKEEVATKAEEEYVKVIDTLEADTGVLRYLIEVGKEQPQDEHALEILRACMRLEARIATILEAQAATMEADIPENEKALRSEDIHYQDIVAEGNRFSEYFGAHYLEWLEEYGNTSLFNADGLGLIGFAGMAVLAGGGIKMIQNIQTPEYISFLEATVPLIIGIAVVIATGALSSWLANRRLQQAPYFDEEIYNLMDNNAMLEPVSGSRVEIADTLQQEAHSLRSRLAKARGRLSDEETEAEQNKEPRSHLDALYRRLEQEAGREFRA